MQTLAESGNIDLFESLVIQAIIRFKWSTYTKHFFVKQFYVFLVFFFLNIVDVYYSLLSKEVDDDDEIINDTRILAVNITLKASCTLILIYFMVYEIKSSLR